MKGRAGHWGLPQEIACGQGLGQAGEAPWGSVLYEAGNDLPFHSWKRPLPVEELTSQTTLAKLGVFL